MARCVNFHPYFHHIPLEFQKMIPSPMSSFLSSDESGDEEVAGIMSSELSFNPNISRALSTPDSGSNPRTSTPLLLTPTSSMEASEEPEDVDVESNSHDEEEIDVVNDSFFGNVCISPIRPRFQAISNRINESANHTTLNESSASPSYSLFTMDYDADGSGSCSELSPASEASPGYSSMSPNQPLEYEQVEEMGCELDDAIIVPTEEGENLPTVLGLNDTTVRIHREEITETVEDCEMEDAQEQEQNAPILSEQEVSTATAPCVIVINTKEISGTLELVLQHFELRHMSETNRQLAWHYVFKHESSEMNEETSATSTEMGMQQQVNLDSTEIIEVD